MDFNQNANCILIVNATPEFVEAAEKVMLNESSGCQVQKINTNAADISFVEKLTPFPNLIFIDLESNEKDGLQFIHDLKHHDELKYIPLMALVVSDDNDLLFKAYSELVNCCIEHPKGAEATYKIVHEVWDFWKKVAEMPKKPNAI